MEMLKASEVAERMSVSRSTVYYLAAQGKLPGYRIGRALRFMEDDVKAYIDACRTAPAHQPVRSPRPASTSVSAWLRDPDKELREYFPMRGHKVRENAAAKGMKNGSAAPLRQRGKATVR
jgi:excisionase family DNA binding protein